MAAFTSLGIGSGVDLNSMVTQLVALERKPLDQMKTDASRLQTQVSSFGKIQGLLGTLQDSANALTGSSLWAQGLPSSADETTVSVSGSSTAAAGSYAVTVQALAGSQTLASSSVFAAATDTVGSGTLSIALGTWDATRSAFTAKAGATALNVTLTATDTLQDLRDKINGADAGVSATLVSDANGVRLSLRSASTGAENGFRITATDTGDGNNTDNLGLSRFAFDPPSGATGLDLKQAAANAKATVNGIAVESASNELGGVVEGLTLRLRKESAAPVDVSVSRDRDSIVSAIKTFADAYNQLTTYITSQTKYDATTKVGATLQGDSAATGLQSQLRAVLATMSGASAAFPRLSDVGLQIQRDGTLKVDSAKLSAATANLTELKKAFANSDSAAPANNGFAKRYALLASQVLDVGGTLTTRNEGLRKLITKNSDDQNRLNDRVDRYQTRLVAQYTAMDANLSKLTALSNYVTQTLASLNKSSTSA
jgi:flagellar hook-associated protein 2